MESRGFYAKRAKDLGYQGPLKYPKGTTQEWKKVCEELEARPIGKKEKRRPTRDEKGKQKADSDDEPENEHFASIKPFPDEEKKKRGRPKKPRLENLPEIALEYDLNDALGTKVYAMGVKDVDILNEENMDKLWRIARSLLITAANKVLDYEPYFQIKFVNQQGASFNSVMHTNLDIVQETLRKEMERMLEIYDPANGEAVHIASVQVHYTKTMDEAIRGAYVAISQANAKWYQPDTPTVKNCVFIAIYTSRYWTKHRILLTDANKRIEKGHDYKRRFKDKLPEGILNDGPSLKDIDTIAELEKITIIVYNNIYEKIAEYNHGAETVEIKVNDGHAIPLIRKSHIRKVNPRFQFPAEPEVVQRQSRTKKIWPSKIQKEHDTRYVAWDIETFVDDKETTQIHLPGQDKTLVVYASGLAYHEDFDPNKDIICKQIWGEKPEGGDGRLNMNVFLDYVREHIETFSGTTFYAHNGGNFDLKLLIRDTFGDREEIDMMQKGFVELNNSIIGLALNFDGHRIYFKDSFRLFQSSLDKITHEFKVDTPKGHLDHNKVNRQTYESFKEEIMKYHHDDCESLLQCIDKFSGFAFNQFKINVTKCYTAASFSKKIVKTVYLPKKPPVYCLEQAIDEFIRESYLGGRNECFQVRRIPAPAYYYDFVSLYPYAGTRYLPVGKPEYINLEGKTILETIKLINMGFVKCEVTGTREMLGGKLPLHGIKKDGKLLFPYIRTPTIMTLFINEIIAGRELGYHYKPIEGYRFDKNKLMKEFFTDCAKYKQEARKNGDDAISAMWKIIINSGYGFWGYNPMGKDTIKLYRKGSRGYLQYLDKGKLKALDKFGDYHVARVINNELPTDTNVSIAAAITSYARIILHNAISDIHKKGGKVYYCDTDSIITDLKLSDHPDLMKKWRPDGKGEEMGSLKNELGTINGEDLPLHELTITGCKSYSCWGNNSKGQVVRFDKLKGYKKEVDQDGNVTEQVSSEIIEKIANDQTVPQVQTRMVCNKNDMARRGREFDHRLYKTERKFKFVYTKGIIGADNVVTPFEI
jgi:DNA polymerase elongation subunit (family B)